MWLFFAITAPLLYAIVHILDSHCVDDIFDKPIIGMVTSGLAAIVIILGVIPFLLPVIDWHWDNPLFMLLSVVSGSLVMASQGLYFKSLSYSEAGIVAAYWNMIPLFVPIGSLLFLGQILTFSQYLGVSLLISTSIFFCLIDTRIEYRLKTILLMTNASLLQASSYLLDEKIFNVLPFFEAFILMTFGYSIFGLIPLVLSSTRKIMSSNGIDILSLSKLFIMIETIDLLGLMSAEKAIDIGIPSLVAAFEGAIPAFTFLISIIVFYFHPEYINSSIKKNFSIKLLLVGFMILGIYLLQ